MPSVMEAITERDSPTIKVWCALSYNRMDHEKTVNSITLICWNCELFLICKKTRNHTCSVSKVGTLMFMLAAMRP
jgi:hypothetical protein